MGTSTARELTCDRPASYPGGVMYSHPLALRKPGISTGLMSLKAREGFNFNLKVCKLETAARKMCNSYNRKSTALTKHGTKPVT